MTDGGNAPADEGCKGGDCAADAECAYSPA